MKSVRLMITGALGAGKSTLVRSVSEIKVVEFERQATAQIPLLKEKITIPLDYGRLNIGSDMAVYLYGTPGQVKFDFIWNLLISRAHGCLVLVAANRPGSFRETNRLLAFLSVRVQIPITIALTHTDCPGAWSQEDVAIALGYADRANRPTIVTVNPTQRSSVLQTLTALVEQLKSKRGAAAARERCMAA